MGKVKFTATVNNEAKIELIRVLELAITKTYEVWDIPNYSDITTADTEIIKTRIALGKLKERMERLCEKV